MTGDVGPTTSMWQELMENATLMVPSAAVRTDGVETLLLIVTVIHASTIQVYQLATVYNYTSFTFVLKGVCPRTILNLLNQFFMR